MQKKVSLKLLPSEAADTKLVQYAIAQSLSEKPGDITGYQILKKSIDARKRQVYVNLSVNAFIKEQPSGITGSGFNFQEVRKALKSVIIIGAGPAGLFAALRLLEAGIKPIIIERGKDVRNRRRDLARLNKEGIIHPDSNYCFGEGGAGTYSDGKLYTRSNKRGDINRILRLFIHFGASENIAYEAHPHIGTNKLPHIITAMREAIVALGGEIHFEKRLVDFVIEHDEVKSITAQDGSVFKADAYILATGHSARDIFYLLDSRGIEIEAKPFALGVRVEHPQSLIDSIQYHCAVRDENLPPASYSLVQQVDGKGVFSFCMCPGGIIAPASTAQNELVVNGWSPSKRDNPYANSGMVVQIEEREAVEALKAAKIPVNEKLAFMQFQQMVEHTSYNAGGGKFVAPAQRLSDFVLGKQSASLPANSYLPGLNSYNLHTVLPKFVAQALKVGFKHFGQKLNGYLTNDAIVVATESRTSSPVRIPRNEHLQHTQIKNLYPCGEGTGYAGGIVSAAMDGERVAEVIAQVYDKR